MSSGKKDIYACWKRIKATGRSISFNKALAMQFEIVQAVPFRTAFFVATRENVFSRAFLYLFVATLPPSSSFFSCKRRLLLPRLDLLLQRALIFLIPLYVFIAAIPSNPPPLPFLLLWPGFRFNF